MFYRTDVLTVDWFYVYFRFSRDLSCSFGVDVGVRSDRWEEEEEELLHQQVSDLIWSRSDSQICTCSHWWARLRGLKSKQPAWCMPCVSVTVVCLCVKVCREPPSRMSQRRNVMRDVVSSGQHQQDDRGDEVKKHAVRAHSGIGWFLLLSNTQQQVVAWNLWQTWIHVCRHVSCWHLASVFSKYFDNQVNVWNLCWLFLNKRVWTKGQWNFEGQWNGKLMRFPHNFDILKVETFI